MCGVVEFGELWCLSDAWQRSPGWLVAGFLLDFLVFLLLLDVFQGLYSVVTGRLRIEVFDDPVGVFDDTLAGSENGVFIRFRPGCYVAGGVLGRVEAKVPTDEVGARFSLHFFDSPVHVCIDLIHVEACVADFVNERLELVPFWCVCCHVDSFVPHCVDERA